VFEVERRWSKLAVFCGLSDDKMSRLRGFDSTRGFAGLL
jgi:hypothetical protein